MKILLVDDSKSARYALRLQLQRHGVEVETADSAEAALDLLEGDLPDAVLMDHMMPGLNGFEALEVIRENPRTAHLPVVMCTAHEDPDFAAAALRKGVIAILPKSVAPEKLPEVLAQLKTAVAAAATERTEPLPQIQPAPSKPAATPEPVAASPSETAPTLSPSELADLVDGRIEAYLDGRLDARIASLFGELRRDLTERLEAQTLRLVEMRLEEEPSVQDNAGPQMDQTEFQALEDRLTRQTLPDLLKIEIEAERGQIMDLVEQYLQEFAPRAAQPDQSQAGRQAALEDAILAKAQETARRESRDAMEAVMERSRQAEDGIKRLQSSLGLVYLGIVAAALSGIAAAVGVYLMLH